MSEARIEEKRANFSMISNRAIEELSPEELWLYTWIYSKSTIPGFSIFKNVMQMEAKERGIGRDRFEKAWKALIEKGYLKRIRLKDEKGHFYYQFEVLEDPEQIEAAEPEEKAAAHPDGQKEVKQNTAAADQNGSSFLSHSSGRSPERIRRTGTDKSEKSVPQIRKEEPAGSSKKSTRANYPQGNYPSYSNLPHGELPTPEPAPYNNTIYNNTNNTIYSSSSNNLQFCDDDKHIPAEVKKDTKYNPDSVLKVITESLGTVPEPEEVNRILSMARNRYTRKAASETIHKPFAYFMEVVASFCSMKETNSEPVIKPNAFHNFHQRDYDYQELEKQLLAAQW
ncbi:MAG: hypothetical protein Q4B85_12570 [Lachnospiraceae bacterium]|nr:hypothetical protein [Lachnospiraceae bacterium]